MNQQLRPCKFIASLQPSALHRSPPHSGAIFFIKSPLSHILFSCQSCHQANIRRQSNCLDAVLDSKGSRSETGVETAIWRSKILLIGRERDQHYPETAHGLKWRWYGTRWCDFPSSCRSYCHIGADLPSEGTGNKRMHKLLTASINVLRGWCALSSFETHIFCLWKEHIDQQSF